MLHWDDLKLIRIPCYNVAITFKLLVPFIEPKWYLKTMHAFPLKFQEILYSGIFLLPSPGGLETIGNNMIQDL
jgi:hypothetical protein